MNGFLFFCSVLYVAADAGIIQDWYDTASDILHDTDNTPYYYEPEPRCDLIIRKSGRVIDRVATVFGDDFVSITCDARCKGPGSTPALVWYRDPSNTPIASTMGRFSSYSRSSDREQRLIFTHFRERDAGSYTCEGWLGPMIGWVKKSVELQIGCSHPKISCDVIQCFPPEYRCDGIRQCDDGFDEYDCGPSVCHDWEFYCDGRCRSSTMRCDGQFDCHDGLDELDCEKDCGEDLFSCLSGKCIPLSWQCDGREDCPEGDDEWCWGSTTDETTLRSSTTSPVPPTSTTESRGCNPEQEYRCWDGSCIPLIWVCDDDDDCPYGEDELYCNETTGTATASYSTPGLQPTSTGRSYSISTARKTSLTTKQRSTPSETSNYSTTVESFSATPTIKPSTESSRPDITTGETKTLKSTASETTITSTVDSSLSPANSSPTTQDLPVCQGMFSCGDGTCIALSRICDNIPDCKDETDEKNCGNSHKSCAEHQRVCKDGKQCINLSQWGDGKCDCSDGSDEINCS